MSKCNYCGSILSSDYLLKRHQKTVKKCIEIQSKLKSIECICKVICSDNLTNIKIILKNV